MCDPHARELGLACLTDSAHDILHDGCAAAIFHDVIHAGVRGSTETRGAFASVLPARRIGGGDGDHGRDVGGGCNIIPDARLWVRMHEARPARSAKAKGDPRSHHELAFPGGFAPAPVSAVPLAHDDLIGRAGRCGVQSPKWPICGCVPRLGVNGPF